jgi:hypothetical protein
MAWRECGVRREAGLLSSAAFHNLCSSSVSPIIRYLHKTTLVSFLVSITISFANLRFTLIYKTLHNNSERKY